MPVIHYRESQRTAEFVEASSIDVRKDIRTVGRLGDRLAPTLVRLEDGWSTSEHVTKTGADYHFSELAL